MIKKCKGTGKAIAFKGCGVELPYFENNGTKKYSAVYGLGKNCGCYSKWLLTTKEGKEVLNKAKIKAKKITDKEHYKIKKEQKNKIKNWRNYLQVEIQKISRLIDIGLPCLARGHHADQMHGGHVFAKGGNSSMALNLHNIHRQSAQSNRFQNDDGLLREGLSNEYGENYMQFISELRRTPQLNYLNMEFMDFYKLAKSISKKLIKDGRRYNKEERIILRNKVNLMLGIYTEEYCVFKNKVKKTV